MSHKHHITGKGKSTSAWKGEHHAGHSYLAMLSPETRAKLLANKVYKTDTRQGGAVSDSPPVKEGK